MKAMAIAQNIKQQEELILQSAIFKSATPVRNHRNSPHHSFINHSSRLHHRLLKLPLLQTSMMQI